MMPYMQIFVSFSIFFHKDSLFNENVGNDDDVDLARSGMVGTEKINFGQNDDEENLKSEKCFGELH